MIWLNEKDETTLGDRMAAILGAGAPVAYALVEYRPGYGTDLEQSNVMAVTSFKCLARHWASMGARNAAMFVRA